MLLFTIFLVGFVLGYDEKKCHPHQLPKASKCVKNHQQVREKAVELDFSDDKNMIKLNNICIDFLNCAETMKCGAEDQDEENINKAVSYCHAVAFHVSSEYLACADTVDTKNSTCVQGWNPFPELDEKAENLEELKKTACANFFGKDGCLEQEITKECSLETWNSFKKHYLALNDIIEACDFS